MLRASAALVQVNVLQLQAVEHLTQCCAGTVHRSQKQKTPEPKVRGFITYL